MERQLALLVVVEHHDIALLFSNYLKSINIDADVMPTDTIPSEHEVPTGKFAILCDPAEAEKAKLAFEEFVQNPSHPKYQEAAWHSAKTPYISKANQSVPSITKAALNQVGPMTLIVAFLCWFVFIVSKAGTDASIFYQLRFSLDLSEPWRLIGPALFHFSWIHVVFNTLWWWILGGQIETQLGKGKLINLFFVSALVSNVAQFYLTGANFGGLSGVVYAVLGYTWWTQWLAPEKGLQIAKPVLGMMLVWLLIGFTDIMQINIANAAHVAGLLSGCILAFIQHKK